MKRILTILFLLAGLTAFGQTYKTTTSVLNDSTTLFRSGTYTANLDNKYARLSDGVVTGLTPTTNGDSLLIASGTYRLNGLIKTATSYVFGDIPPSSVGLSRVLVVYGLNTGVLDTLSGAESNNPVAPTFGTDTVILVQVLVSDAGLGVPSIDDSNYAKLSGGNTFSGIQDFNNRVRVFDDLYFDQIPVRSWTIKADSGFLKIKSGDALSSVDFQNQPTYLGTKLIADTTVYRTVSNSYSLSSGQAKLTAINFGNFMDIGLSTKLTPSSGDFLLGRDFLTNEAVEIPFSTVQPALGYTPYNPSSYPVNFGGETLQSVTNRDSVTTTDIIANNLESKNYLRVTDLGGVKRILLGNQNSLGVNKPSIIESANSNISFGYGDTWTADGGNFTSRVFIKNDDNSGNVGIGTTTVPEKLNIAGTTRATNFGANIAPNTNFGFTGAASTTTTAPFLITPGVAYTGTQNGALWYETTNSRLRMYRSSQVDDIVTTGSNILFGGTGVRAVTATTDGSLAATTPILSVFTTDSDVITAITGATYSGNRATITPAGGKVFYQGQMYDDGSFTYLAIADNSVRRF